MMWLVVIVASDFVELESVCACERRFVSPPLTPLNRPFHQQSSYKALSSHSSVAQQLCL